MMKDNSLYNEYTLAHALGKKHSEIMTMTNTEYLEWMAFFKRRQAEGG
ncbi:hypothetical protein LCGC14_2874650 [marine sediment metagenome]|uniref:Uncharacterized protein n=1 Tax=marine sediment metagenome TaxID=412755 RepID=A0A0F9AA11_9ZZZZ